MRLYWVLNWILNKGCPYIQHDKQPWSKSISPISVYHWFWGKLSGTFLLCILDYCELKLLPRHDSSEWPVEFCRLWMLIYRNQYCDCYKQIFAVKNVCFTNLTTPRGINACMNHLDQSWTGINQRYGILVINSKWYNYLLHSLQFWLFCLLLPMFRLSFWIFLALFWYMYSNDKFI